MSLYPTQLLPVFPGRMNEIASTQRREVPVTNKRCTSSLLSAFVIEFPTQLLNKFSVLVFDTQVKKHSSHVFRRRGKRVPVSVPDPGGPALLITKVEYLGTLRYLTTVRVPTVPY